MRLLATLVALSSTAVSYGFIGPTANLFIRNKVIAPDGFSRSYVVDHLRRYCSDPYKINSAVLAGGTANSVAFPGPNIRGLKVIRL